MRVEPLWMALVPLSGDPQGSSPLLSREGEKFSVCKPEEDLCQNPNTGVVQLLGHVWLFATPWTAARQAPLSSTTSQSLLKFTSTESVMLSNCLILCYPLLFLPPIFPSIRIFSSESDLFQWIGIRWPKYWRFIFSDSPTNEYSGLISFRIDWFDLSVQGTLKSLFSSTTIQKHQFFGAQPF